MDQNEKRIRDIAQVVHETNRAYCATIGDNSQAPWDECPEWQKSSAIKGVELIINNPNTTPEESHESWLAEKRATGWSYGPVKDAEAKTHPCLVPYDQLPEAQRRKDHLFGTVVRALL